MRDSIPLPHHATKSMDNVAPGVKGVQIVMVNVYGITTDDGWVLIDAGLPFAAGRIRRWAESKFGPATPPKCVVLTHGHFDHVGSLTDLVRTWKVPVYAHPMEFPYLKGASRYPPPDPLVGGGAMPFTSAIYPRGPIQIQDQLQPLSDDGMIPELPDWRWIHTPGHTPGHVSLFRDDDRTLIAGDAFVTTKQESFFSVATQRPEMTGPPPYFTSDWDAARLSVQRLAGLYPTTMATGHGLPVAGQEALNALQTLAETFDERAVPSSGRYVRSPEVADERGVRSVPPLPAANKAARIATGAAVGAMVWMVWSRRARRATWS